MATNQDKLIIQVVDQATKPLQTINKQLKELSGDTQQATKGAQSTSMSFGNLAKSGAIAGGAFYVAQKALTILSDTFTSSIDAANKYTSAMVGLSSVSNAFGVNSEEAKMAAQELASDGLMTLSEASAGLKNLIATGFELPQAIELMKGFKDSAAFGRQGALDFGEAIVGATEGLKNGNPILVDNAGITKNLSVILEEAGYSQQDLMKATTDSSARTALFNGILEETAIFAGDADRATDTFTGTQSKLTTRTNELKVSLGLAIQQGLQPFYSGLIDLLQPSKQVQDETQKSTAEINSLSNAFYIAGNFSAGAILRFKQFGLSLGLVAKAVGLGTRAIAENFANAFGNAAKIVDNFKNKIQSAGGFISKALQGDFAGAKEAAGNVLGGSILEGTTSFTPSEQLQEELRSLLDTSAIEEAGIQSEKYFNDAAYTFQTGFQKINNVWKDGTEEIEKTTGGGGFIGSIAKGAKEAEKSASSYISAFESVADKSSDLLEKFNENARRIKQEFRKTIEDIKKKGAELAKGFASDFGSAIVEIQDTIKSLTDSMLASTRGFDAQMAGVVIKTQDEIANLQTQLNEQLSLGSLDQDQSFIEELQSQIAEREGFLSKHSGVISQIQDSINEERRKAGLDEIETLQEQKDAEVSELQAQIDTENAILDKHAEDIASFNDAITEARRQSSLDQIEILKEQFAAERALLEQEKEAARTKRKKDRKKNRNELRAGFQDVSSLLYDETGEMSQDFSSMPTGAQSSFNSAVGAINAIGAKIGGFNAKKDSGKQYNININTIQGESLEDIMSRLGVMLKTLV